ncbi:hypothetical protein IKF92_00990 [Candidatus Saccharibacteria bacterium]|nr:hypothetical protein [Candidatus Saccharibacteria bacterium]
MYASDFKITSIEYEDGSGNRLILNGYCSADLNDGRDIYDRLDYMDYDVRAFNHSHCSSDKEYDGKELLKKYTFSMFYDAEKRKGNISFSG